MKRNEVGSLSGLSGFSSRRPAYVMSHPPEPHWEASPLSAVAWTCLQYGSGMPKGESRSKWGAGQKGTCGCHFLKLSIT